MKNTNALTHAPKKRRRHGLLTVCAATAMLAFGTVASPALAADGNDVVTAAVATSDVAMKSDFRDSAEASEAAAIAATPAGAADTHIPLGSTGADLPSFIILGVALVMAAGSVVLTVRRKEAAE